MAEGIAMETVEMRQLSRVGHLPMKSAPESVGYEIWPSCDVILKSQTITSVCTGVRVDLPPGYAGVIYNKLGLAQEGILVVPYVLDVNLRGPLYLVMLIDWVLWGPAYAVRGLNVANERLFIQPMLWGDWLYIL